ncbi:MAG: type II secretion system F family protein [Candidatus Methanomethylicaceae archaeon]
MTVVAKELPPWMSKKDKEEMELLEAKKIKERTKVSFKDRLLALRHARTIKYQWHTLPFFLMHMLVCAYADISSLEIVRATSRSNFGSITKFMKKISVLVELGIDLPRSIEITRKDARLPYFRDFLQRFSQIAKMGEDMIAFLNKEYGNFMIVYSSDMERSNTRLRRFTEAYSAILSSGILIVMIMIFSGMIWGAGLEFISAVVPGVIVIYGLFSVFFYVYSPVVKMISNSERSENVERLLKFEKLLLRLTLIACTAVLVLLIFGLAPRDLGIIILSVAGLPLLIIGYLGRRRIKVIESLDERFPEFMTMLTTSLSNLGTSIIYAFQDIAKLDFGKLSPHIKSLAAKFGVGISKTKSWESFKKNTSSELIRIHVEAFNEASLYGSPAKVFGPLITNSSIFLLTLRKRVEETAALMRGIVVPMHPILCAIMGLIMAIVETFSEMFKQFQHSGISIVFGRMLSVSGIATYVYILIFALSIINAFIIHEISGEQEFNMSFHTGLFLLSGWMAYYLCLTLVANYLSYIGLSRMVPVPF